MPHSSLRPSQRLAPRCGQYWSMIPTTPLVSRKASSSSPITTIFFGGPSASGNSASDLVLVAGIGIGQPLDRLQRASRFIEIDVAGFDAHDARDRRVVLFFLQIGLAADVVGGLGRDPEAAEFRRQARGIRSDG